MSVSSAKASETVVKLVIIVINVAQHAGRLLQANEHSADVLANGTGGTSMTGGGECLLAGRIAARSFMSVYRIHASEKPHRTSETGC